MVNNKQQSGLPQSVKSHGKKRIHVKSQGNSLILSKSEKSHFICSKVKCLSLSSKLSQKRKEVENEKKKYQERKAKENLNMDCFHQ